MTSHEVPADVTVALTLEGWQSTAWIERLQRRQQSPHAEIWDLLDAVKDPEIPVVQR